MKIAFSYALHPYQAYEDCLFLYLKQKGGRTIFGTSTLIGSGEEM